MPMAQISHLTRTEEMANLQKKTIRIFMFFGFAVDIASCTHR